MATEATLLADVGFFKFLDEDERAVLAQQVEQRTFPAGTTIFREGDPGGIMYVIRSGKVAAGRSRDGPVHPDPPTGLVLRRPDLLLKIEELTPTTSPRALVSGPPELPGLMAASVWIMSRYRPV